MNGDQQIRSLETNLSPSSRKQSEYRCWTELPPTAISSQIR